MLETRVVALVLALLGAVSARAQVPPDKLAVPPAGAAQISIISTPTLRHGQTYIWTDDKGAHWSRESLNLRGFINEVDQRVVLAKDGTVQSLTVRGSTPTGDAGESFKVENGTASWVSPVDHGSAAYAGPRLYAPYGGTYDANVWLVDALLAAPGHRVGLLPAGEARLEPLATATIGAGPARRALTAYVVLGVATSPLPFWADAQGHLFAQVGGGLSWIPAGYEADLPVLEKAQSEALSRRSPKVLTDLLQPAAGPVAFTHVEMFDAEAGRFVKDQTVVVDAGKIVSVGPAARTPAPAGAKIIAGEGKTLVPGLWDMHQHYGDDSTGPLLLSLGVTSVRDPGNDNERTLDRARRRAAGLLLSPNVYPSSLIDGKSPYTAQLGTVATSRDEALAAVRKAKADGFTGIKIYGSFNPAWVAATAAEAHRLGLHVHGHIPAGMRPLEAVNAGYDEITHINFVMMQAMPDSLVAKSNTAARIDEVGVLAANVDLNAEPMKSLIATLAARHITVDATLSVMEASLVPDPGELAAAYAPYAGVFPPATARSFLGGSDAPPAGSSRAQFRASFAKLEALTGALHKAGVRIVAGTDGFGVELVRELELYVDAGFTPAEALEAATLDAARTVGVDQSTGSIAVGKTADLVLVEGDPGRRIGDLRNTRLVMLAGRPMDANALRSAAGLSGRPR
jgi:imidazolonepropionase-like amidohydrolase